MRWMFSAPFLANHLVGPAIKVRVLLRELSIAKKARDKTFIAGQVGREIPSSLVSHAEY
jgi:hypothetical protein